RKIYSHSMRAWTGFYDERREQQRVRELRRARVESPFARQARPRDRFASARRSSPPGSARPAAARVRPIANDWRGAADDRETRRGDQKGHFTGEPDRHFSRRNI